MTRFSVPRFIALTLIGVSTFEATSIAQGPPASPVVVAPIVDQKIHSGQTFVGTIHPEQQATIGSAVDGRVVEFPVNEGDRVESGQALAQLLTETINLELEAAKGELRLREQELLELKNGTRPEEVEEARANLAAARAAMSLSEKKLDRVQRLYATGNAATQEQLDEAQASVAGAKAFMEQRAAVYQQAMAGPRIERIAQAEARVAIQKAIVEKLSDQIKKHTMIARFAGYVVAEHTEVGQWVNRGDPVAEIVALDRVDVEAHVLESHIPFIKKGMPSRVEVPALKDHLFTGNVVIVVPRGDARSRTFPVKVRLQNEFDGDKPLLNAGMLARVTLPTGPVKQGQLVPKDALVLGGPQPVVFVVDTQDQSTGKVRPVPVQVGVPSGSLIEIIGETVAGQLVVVQGNERLRPGQDVKIIRTIDPKQPLEPADKPQPSPPPREQ